MLDFCNKYFAKSCWLLLSLDIVTKTFEIDDKVTNDITELLRAFELLLPGKRHFDMLCLMNNHSERNSMLLLMTFLKQEKWGFSIHKQLKNQYMYILNILSHSKITAYWQRQPYCRLNKPLIRISRILLSLRVRGINGWRYLFVENDVADITRVLLNL